MKDKPYKLIEFTGTPTKSIDDAVNTMLKARLAVNQAARRRVSVVHS
jgi:flavin-binding protein dodecin